MPINRPSPEQVRAALTADEFWVTGLSIFERDSDGKRPDHAEHHHLLGETTRRGAGREGVDGRPLRRLPGIETGRQADLVRQHKKPSPNSIMVSEGEFPDGTVT